MNTYLVNIENTNKITTVNVPDIGSSKRHLLKNDFEVDANSIYFLHTNIRSLSKNFESLELFLHTYENLYHVIVLTETFNIVNVELFRLKGYSIYYNTGAINKNDGVVVFVKNTLTHICNTISYSNLKILRLTLTVNKQKIGVTGIYRPPSYSVQDFFPYYTDYLSNHCNLKNEIIMGDFNINILQNNDVNEQYLNLMSEHAFLSYINDFTRIENNSKSCIDHIFIKTDISPQNILPIILHSKISDHFPQLLKITLQEKINNNLNKQNSNIISSINYDILKNYLSNNVNWDDILQGNDVNNTTEIFIDAIKNAVQMSTEYKTLKHSNRKRKSWITLGLMTSINYRDELYEQSLKNPNNIQLENQYKYYRNYLNKLIKKSKQNFYKQKINENLNDTSKIWSYTNELLNKDKVMENKLKYIKTEDGNIISDEKEVADYMNNFFTNIGTNIAKNIKVTDYKHKVKMKIKDTMFIQPITENDVINYINKLKTDTAPGKDGIHSKTLKFIKNDIAIALVKIINLSFTNGIFPNILKEAVVKPIYKGGDADLADNYRPISLISNIAKIFEYAIKDVILNFCKKHNILAKQQFGFQEKVSTQDAISKLIGRVYQSIDKSKPSIAVFLDLAKAFDTISHKKLISKLPAYGFRGKILQLIESYLSQRVQYVRNGNVISEPMTIKSGVPQGTVIGPILFILYINDIFELEDECYIVSYADDTALYVEGNCWPEVQRKTEKLLQNIKAWLDENLLILNYGKTKFLTFSSNAGGQGNFNEIKIHEFSCNLSEDCNCEISIERKTSVKYLGIIVDCHLKWDEQIYAVCSKLRKLIYIFKQLKHVLSLNLLRTAYYALAQSIMTYGLLVWGMPYNNVLKNVYTTQNLLLKIILSKPMRYPTSQLFSDFEVCNFQQLYTLEIFKYLYKSRPVMLPTHSHVTRFVSNASCIPPFMKKRLGQRNFIYFSTKIYNAVPSDIKNYSNKSYRLFMKLSKKWIAENQVFIRQLFEQI